MPFPKGKSGNPKGRPPGSFSITGMIKDKLQTCPKGQKKTYAQILIEEILKKAIKRGDHHTQKMIWNYIDGLPKGELDLTSGGEPIQGFNYITPNDPNNKTDL